MTGSFFLARKSLKILMKDKRKRCMVRTERKRDRDGREREEKGRERKRLELCSVEAKKCE